MKKLFTRPPTRPSAALPDEQPDAEHDWDDESPEESGGWSTGARANTTALLRWAAWGLLVTGPLLGAAAYLSIPAAGSARPQPAASAPAATGAQGAAGFAQLFVGDFIAAGEGEQDRLSAYFPGAAGVRLEGEPGWRSGERLTVVRLRQTADAVWSVTVAARITIRESAGRPAEKDGQGGSSTAKKEKEAEEREARESTVRYFQVPVATGPASGGATGFTALAMPAEVSAPDRIKAPVLAYEEWSSALPSDPRTQAVTEFLSAYLTGTGELDRYLAPGTKLRPVTPAPYSGIAVDQLAIEEGGQDSAVVTTVPRDGTRLRLMVALRATDHDGVRAPLTYALTLSARAGRWEIKALDGAPAPQSTRPASPPKSGAAPTP